MRRLWVIAGSALLLAGAGCSADPADPDSAAPPRAPASAPADSVPTGASPGGGTTGVPPAGGSKPGAAAGGASAGGDARAKAVEEAARAGNTIGICDQAAKVSGTAAATFAADLKLLIEASSANDKARIARAEEKARRDVENWSFALGDMSKLVADPDVKKALADMSRSVAKLKGNLAKVDPAALDGLRRKLDRACGKS